MICLLDLFKLYITWLEETKTKSLILYNFRTVYNMLVSLYYGVHFLLSVFLSVTCQYPATLFVSLSVCLSLSLSVSVSFCLCLSVSLSQSLICSSVLGSLSSGVLLIQCMPLSFCWVTAESSNKPLSDKALAVLA